MRESLYPARVLCFLAFKEDITLIFEPGENPQWPDDLEFCDISFSKKGSIPKITVSVNLTNHDITLSGRTTIGTVQSVGPVYPASIFRKDLPSAAVNKSHIQDTTGCTPTSEQWEPPVVYFTYRCL